MPDGPGLARRQRVRRTFGDLHGVEIIDTPSHRVRHPSDLLALVLYGLGVVLVLVLAAYAQGTTAGVTEDVQGFSSTLRRILFFPIDVLEGLVTVAVPIAVIIALAVRRLGRQVLEAIAAAVLGLVLGVVVAWAIRSWGSAELLDALTVRLRGQAVVNVPGYVAAVTALLTVAGPRTRRRTVAWSWNVLWVALGVTLITGQISLPGVLTVVLLGRVAGFAVRYASGVQSERAYGSELVDGVRRAGFNPRRLVRVRDVADDRAPEANELAAIALARYDDNRVYAMTTDDGERYDVVALDGDRQVVGILTRFWRSLRLRGIDGRAVVSLRQAAERAALLGYAARAAGVRTPRLLGMAETADTMLLIQEHATGATPLRDLPGEEITDEVLEQVWQQLDRAHTAGIAHRALTADVVLVARDEGTGPTVWLTGWSYGDVASSGLARRIDLAQMVALLALRVGAERAIASATQVLSTEDLAAIGPLLQSIALPRGTREELRGRGELLAELRAALLVHVPEADVEPQRLVRFGARTVITLTLTIAAVVIVVTTLNFAEIADAVRGASPWWVLAAFLAGLLTFVGAGLALIAFSPVRLPPWTVLLTQVAGAFIALVAPAGVGPAALNLRLLTRRRVPASLAVGTVAFVQVSVFVVTVALLLVLSLFTGTSGALRSLPSSTVLGALAIAALVIAVVLVIPAARQWVVAKTAPMVRQTWPRLVQMLSRPKRLALGVAGNLITTLAYLAAFYACLAAFGRSMPLIDIALIYLISNSVGAMVPTPGGLGAIELTLTGALTAAGVPAAIAASVVVLFRGLTYWARVPLGWLAMRHLQRTGEL